MRILILNWRDIKNPLYGGAELVTQEHARGWVRAGHTVTWLSSAFKGCKTEEELNGIRIFRRGTSVGVYFWAPLFVISHRNEFDVIVDEVHGIPFFTPLYTRIPRVAFIHEIAGVIWDVMLPLPFNIIGKMLEKIYLKIYRNCYFWTDAPSTVDELVGEGIARSRCFAIPCPIIKTGSVSVNYHKSEHPVYVFVSRLVKMKGIEKVIDAFALIRKDVQSAQLWVIGSGTKDYTAALRRKTSSLGISESVFFKGWVSEKEKYELLSRAHILLHASIKEGWGLVVLEAASVGTPSVVFNVPGLRDVVKNDVTGIVVDNNTSLALAQAALDLTTDSKRYYKFRKNGIKWAESLTWDNAACESEQLLRIIVNNG